MDWSNLKMVLIEWEDAASVDAWESIKDALADKKKLNTVKTVGFLLEETIEFLLVGQNLDIDGENVAGRVSIPCACVTRLVELCPKKKTSQ